MGPRRIQSEVPSLIDTEGFLWDNVQQVVEHAKAEEVRIELKAQIDKALAFGVPLSHLDAHMGAAVSRPDLVDVVRSLSLEYDLPVLSFDNSMRKRPRIIRIGRASEGQCCEAIREAIAYSRFDVAILWWQHSGTTRRALLQSHGKPPTGRHAVDHSLRPRWRRTASDYR